MNKIHINKKLTGLAQNAVEGGHVIIVQKNVK
jgi:hypothetical protein